MCRTCSAPPWILECTVCPPRDEKEEDNAVNHTSDSPEGESNLPDTAQERRAFPAEGYQHAIDDACVTFVRNVDAASQEAVSDRGNGIHDVLESKAVPVLIKPYQCLDDRIL